MAFKKILLITPPMTQINTPYPATAYLTGYLRMKGYQCTQRDGSIDLFLKLFSKQGLIQVRDTIQKSSTLKTEAVSFFLEAAEDYIRTINDVVLFLQGKNPSLSYRIVARTLLPEGPRFVPTRENPENLELAFGQMGLHDKAKYLATLYIDDLADVIHQGVDSKFKISRYAEKLAASAESFEPLRNEVQNSNTLIDKMLIDLTKEYCADTMPDVVGFSAPFPGNIYGAFKMAQTIKALNPKILTVLGGGYPNTELRNLKEPAVFDSFDFITLDDGERPFELILEGKKGGQLLRTFYREKDEVQFHTSPKEHDIPFKDSGTPTYDGLKLDRYLSVVEVLNPMHRIWSDVRWNKITLAHGCYWKKCSFCDVSLDYIGRYDPVSADMTLDRMRSISLETKTNGFHFVDEAAPPKILSDLSKRILEKAETYVWWGNIRFEKTFTKELTQLMSDAGCVAVTGGLEVASDRLLKKMNKGVTVEQVAYVSKCFQEAGILVHAYLMYGFPTQTAQETIDSLERVRQLFENGCLTSAYWHRFSATAHSPIGLDPESFGIEIKPNAETKFSRNDLEFYDPTECDHDAMGVGLNRALYNYMHGVGLDWDLKKWFDVKVPKTTVEKNFVAKALRIQKKK